MCREISFLFYSHSGSTDISKCTWIDTRNPKSRRLIITFTSLITRNLIMKKYSRNTKLELSKLVPCCNISGRLYLNDNHPPEANDLYLLARWLCKSNLIKTFKMNYADCTVEVITLRNEYLTFFNIQALRWYGTSVEQYNLWCRIKMVLASQSGHNIQSLPSC